MVESPEPSVAKVPEDDAAATAATAPTYPYLQILNQLQTKAIRAQDPAAATEDATTTNNSNNEGEEEKSEQPWDLTTDALLATLLHEFSTHVAYRTHHVASDIRSLQSSVNEAGVDVSICQTQFMRRSADIFMEQVVGDDDSESSSDSEEDDEEEEEEGSKDGEGPAADKKSNAETNEDQNADGGEGGAAPAAADDDENSSASIARLEAEEKSAIADGMKALNLFFDPKRPKPSSSEGGGGGSSDTVDHHALVDVDEDIIGENCYYYPAAEDDGFNQRPLPFIVGSREFMESSCAGLGGDGGEHQG